MTTGSEFVSTSCPCLAFPFTQLILSMYTGISSWIRYANYILRIPLSWYFIICDLLCENRPFQHIWYFEKYHFEKLKPLQFSCAVF